MSWAELKLDTDRAGSPRVRRTEGTRKRGGGVNSEGERGRKRGGGVNSEGEREGEG